MKGATILAAIGNTPLIRLRRLAPDSGAELWVKLEYVNPSGSMKDRMALSMIEGAERDGLLEPGTTVVEYTGGSTGPALALVCRAKGYRARIVISDCFTEERMRLMRALGAELEILPAVEERPRDRAGHREHGLPGGRARSGARLVRHRPVQQPLRGWRTPGGARA